MARLNYVKSFRGTTKTESGNLRCGRCGDDITPGDGYRWWANRAPGQRGSFRQIRCLKQTCAPTTAERTPGRRGQLMQIQEDAEDYIAQCKTLDDLTAAVEQVGEEAKSIAEELREGAQNIEEGFGHPTSQSEELEQRADDLESQCDNLDGWEPSDSSEPERDDFEDDPEGEENGGETGEEKYEAAHEEWLETARGEATDAINELDVG